jgi:hypothetical protein
MIILLHILAVILKPIHWFFHKFYACWFILVFNRNISLFLVVLSSYLLLKPLYSRCVQFYKHIDTPAKDVYSSFLYTFKIIVELHLIACEFWFISCVFSNVDLWTSYKYEHIYEAFIFCELIPYLYLISYRLPKFLIKLLKGDYKRCVRLKSTYRKTDLH